MSKRLTDTDKWERPWFRSLEYKYKILWCYILDKCDIAGIWYVDFGLASFLTGIQYDPKESEKALGKQIQVNGDRWLIIDFIPFQYGNLTETNKLHSNVKAKLMGFDGASMGHKWGIYPPKRKDKDKDKDKDKEKESNNINKRPTIIEVRQYCNERKNGVNPDKFFDFYEAKGWMMGKNQIKDWKACVRTWERNNTDRRKDPESIPYASQIDL